MKRPDELIVYSEWKENETLCKMVNSMIGIEEKKQIEEIRDEFSTSFHEILEMADRHGFEGNIWHTYLSYLLIMSENAYSLSKEGVTETGKDSISVIVCYDMEIIREWYRFDWMRFSACMDESVLNETVHYRNDKLNRFELDAITRKRISGLSRSLSQSASREEFCNILTNYYKSFGAGQFGLYKAFRLESKGDGSDIIPVTSLAQVHLEDLVGYGNAKEKLIANTESFLAGRRVNNCLLYGDAGTGKSTSIKALLNTYFEKGLRIIEIYKHQFKDINAVISQIKNRNYKFILFMDDLSFEEFETDYKYLKAVIEGGLESKPENVIIYATSNRRHLVKETFADKEGRREDLHSSDTVQEKLSLAYRFGITIFFGAPNKKEFQNIVLTLADRYGISMDREELLSEANKWELSHGGLSGRCAAQFIDYLLGK